MTRSSTYSEDERYALKVHQLTPGVGAFMGGIHQITPVCGFIMTRDIPRSRYDCWQNSDKGYMADFMKAQGISAGDYPGLQVRLPLE